MSSGCHGGQGGHRLVAQGGHGSHDATPDTPQAVAHRGQPRSVLRAPDPSAGAQRKLSFLGANLSRNSFQAAPEIMSRFIILILTLLSWQTQSTITKDFFVLHHATGHNPEVEGLISSGVIHKEKGEDGLTASCKGGRSGSGHASRYWAPPPVTARTRNDGCSAMNLISIPPSAPPVRMAWGGSAKWTSPACNSVAGDKHAKQSLLFSKTTTQSRSKPGRPPEVA